VVAATRRHVGLIYLLVIAGYAAWILSLPVFPSQDGPAHVYFADVASHLWSGNSVFSGSYEIVHPISPYALQTYLLIPLLRLAGPVWAEKFLVCVIVVVTAAGMRLFAMRLGDAGDLVALLATPFFTNYFLFMGFYNYCLAVGLALLAAGIWSGGNRTQAGRRIAFVLLAWLAAIAHPVGFGLLIAYCAAMLIVAAVGARWSSWTLDLPRARLGDVIALAIAAAPLAYTATFVNSSERSLRNSTFVLALRQGYDWLRLLLFADMGYVSPIASATFRLILAAVVLTLAVAAAGVTFGDFRARRLRVSSMVLLFGVLLALAMPALPSLVNDYGFYFAERLAIVGTLLLIAAGASVEIGERRWIVAGIGVLLAAVTLGALDREIRPTAMLLAVPNSAAIQPGSRAIVIDGARNAAPVGLHFDPCRLAGVRLIEAANGIWEHTPPWANSSILMVHPTRQMSDADADELLRGGEASIIVIHCGDRGAPVFREWESRYAERSFVTRGAFADVLRPLRKF
jgi:hypothetical protein